MNAELLHLIDQISREKGIEKETLVEAISLAILSAGRKRFGLAENLAVRLDEQTGGITLCFEKEVVKASEVTDDTLQVSLEDARAIRPGACVGETVEAPQELEDFGRIAAQTAKQVIIQKVRDAERDMVYREFKHRQGDLINGIVTRVEREGNLMVDLGKTEALLPRREQSFREVFKRGDRIRAHIIEVKRSSSGPQVILSRTHPVFLMRLFEMEVPEIYEGIIEIKAAARDASGRAKIAVMSNDNDIDPIGACVGMRGMRVQSVVQELRGEKIDIVQWTEDAVQFVHNALSPAKVVRIEVNEEEKTMQVLVAEDQLSLAIGKRGQNVRLAAKLTNWKIDIRNAQETEGNSEREEALRIAESVFQPAKSDEEDDAGSTEQQEAPSASPVNAVPPEC